MAIISMFYGIFRTVRVTMGTISWKNGQDFCPDTLYEDSVPLTVPLVELGER